MLKRVGKSAIFALNRVRVQVAGPHLHTQGYIEYPPARDSVQAPCMKSRHICIYLLGHLGFIRVCSSQRIQKRIFDLRFARFRGRKEREIRNWICNLGNLSPTRAICTTASQKMTCFLLFDKLCDYTVQNLAVGSSNSDDGTYKIDQERSALKMKII